MLWPTQFGHGNATALKVLKSADDSGLYTVFGEQSANHQQLLKTGRKFICSLYGVAAGESMASARYALYTKRTTGEAGISHPASTLPSNALEGSRPADSACLHRCLRVGVGQWCRVYANSTHCKRTSSCPHPLSV